MKKLWWSIITCLFLALSITTVVAAPGGQEPPGRDPAFEQEIYDRLAEIDPDAVPIFQEATRAMDEGDLTAAKEGYEQVLALAPDFPDAARRLSYVEIGLGDVESAVQHAEQAYAADPSPYNQSALARALLATEDPDRIAEALSHAQQAAEALPEDAEMQFILLWAGAVNQDVGIIRQASAALIQIAPDEPVGHFFAGLIAAEDGNWEEAERELLLAQELGMPAEDIQEPLATIRSQARMQRLLRSAAYALAYTLGGWVVALPVLFLAGVFLSRLTLAAVDRTEFTGQFEVGRGERIVRSIYRVVIAITSLYFYVSIPLLILVVVAVTGGIFYLFLLAGRIPLQLVFGIGLAAIYTLYAIVRSLFVRGKGEDPGRALSQEEAPRLWSLTEEVAEQLKTRPIEAIYITPAPEIAVTERGRLWQKLRGAGQRCLILGLGALSGMTQDQFKAILAHEYGHFSSRDTAGGNLARQVQLSMNHMAFRLAITGQARWYNPAWLFLNGFHRVFLRITLGASRLQEILADRYAAVAYGVRNLTNGLKHIIRQALVFNMQVTQEVETAQKEGRDLRNLYTLPPLQDDEQQEQLETRVAEAMSRATSPYDSHPAPRHRIALLEQVKATARFAESPGPAWDLLPIAETLQAEMTTHVEDNVRQRQKFAREVAARQAESRTRR